MLKSIQTIHTHTYIPNVTKYSNVEVNAVNVEINLNTNIKENSETELCLNLILVCWTDYYISILHINAIVTPKMSDNLFISLKTSNNNRWKRKVNILFMYSSTSGCNCKQCTCPIKTSYMSLNSTTKINTRVSSWYQESCTNTLCCADCKAQYVHFCA